MISKEQRIKLEELIEAKATALATLQQADPAAEAKVQAAFDYVRASDNLDSYLTSLTEAPTAADHGWIEYSGEGCPLAEETVIDVRYRDGEVVKGLKALCIDHRRRDASYRFWEIDGYNNDIVAYRIVG